MDKWSVFNETFLIRHSHKPLSSFQLSSSYHLTFSQAAKETLQSYNKITSERVTWLSFVGIANLFVYRVVNRFWKRSLNDRFFRFFNRFKKRLFLKTTHSFLTFRKWITIVFEKDRFYKNDLRLFLYDCF